MWDWGGPATFAHDELTTDKRNPTANAYGPIYGVDWGNDGFLIVDPLEHTAEEIRIPVLDPKVPPGKPQKMPVPSPYWGDKLYWFDPAITNHAAMDGKGRVWMSSRFRRAREPAGVLQRPSVGRTRAAGQQLPPGAVLRSEDAAVQAGRHLLRYAPRAVRIEERNALRQRRLQWRDRLGRHARSSTQTGDEAAAQGWCRGVSRRQPGREDRSRCRSSARRQRDLQRHPASHDGSVWGAAPGPMPGKILRIDPKTCVGEAYEPPFDPAAGVVGYTPRGIDVDSNGVIWTALASSGHLASFDRRKCKGRCRGRRRPTANTAAKAGRCIRCRARASEVCAATSRSTSSTTTSSTAHNTLGLGADVPLANGTNSDSLLALQPDGSWVVLRVPYPLGFFSRGMDGRIDDPNGGWKGRGLYADYGPNAAWHIEGGLGTRSSVVKFQLRPDPLAK